MTSGQVINTIGKMIYCVTERIIDRPDVLKKQKVFVELVGEMKELVDLIAQGKLKVEVAE